MRFELLRTIREDDKNLVLRRNGTSLELVLGNVVLLSSAALETERTFGQLSKPTFGASKRVVIGGLGFGSTLRGVLDVAPADAEIIVVEKLRTVAEIARAEAADLVAGALDDPRVTLLHTDVADVIAEAPPASLAAVLLDVDNGPEWASFRTNARLYADAALAQARRALAPGGLYAVWSGYAVDKFLGALRGAGFVARIEPLRERGVVRARAYLGS